MLNEFGKLGAYRYLQCLHIKRHNVVLPATLITIINDVLPNVVFRDGLFDVCCTLTIEGEVKE